MTAEDEEFNRVEMESRIKQEYIRAMKLKELDDAFDAEYAKRRDKFAVKPKVDEDDDIQEYKKPWVSLSNKEIEGLCDEWRIIYGAYVEEFAKDIETKLRQLNT